jgi:hypothetical protein
MTNPMLISLMTNKLLVRFPRHKKRFVFFLARPSECPIRFGRFLRVDKHVRLVKY